MTPARRRGRPRPADREAPVFRLDTFLQQIINGVTLGSVYAIVALGYTMVYGIIQLINFAHGEVVMIGAMVAYSVIVALVGSGRRCRRSRSLSPEAGSRSPCAWGRLHARARRLPAAAQRAPPRPADHRDRPVDHPAALAMIVWSRNPLPYPQIVKTVSYHVTANPNGATITNVQIAIIVVSIAMMAGLTALVYRTKLGIAMRATAQNQAVAGLMGIDINRVIALTFVIAGGWARSRA